MKNIFYILLLLPTIIFAQYPSNSGQKITLGEQTTADGLVYRGLAADTTRKPSVDTMAYILLDTNTNIIWQYKKATSNAWTRVGGSISSGVTGTLPVANGGTGATSLSPNNYLIRTNSSGVFDTAAIFEAGGNVGIGVVPTSLSDATYNNLQIGQSGVIAAYNSGAGVINFGQNYYNNGGWKRLVTDASSQIQLNTGTIDFRVAASGSANSAITWTSAMNIDNTGNVGIGTASPTYKLDVNGTGRFVDSIFLGNAIIGKTKQNNNSIRFGINAGLSTGDKNVAIGTNNLQKDTGGENVAIGFEAGKNLTTGTRNMLLGSNAGSAMTTAGSNVVVGATALFLHTSAGETVAIGRASMEQATSGDRNTSIGTTTLYNNEGNDNTAVGYHAGWAGNSANKNTTGSNNTFIGNGSVGASGTASNVITLGNSSIATIRAQVTTITSLSDIRDKTEILPLNYGMNFINKLKPVSFVWDMRDGGKIGIQEIGFIAQDLQQAQIDSGVNVPNLVSGVDEKLEASYGVLLPIIVKALQEANEKIKILEQRIINLENK